MIGILAGMGPRSTSPFLERVLDECTAQYGARLDADFPPMMIHSLPTPFALGRPIDRRAMTEAIAAGIGRLVEARTTVIAMPCNVAHLYFEDVTRGVRIPVLNLIDITAARVPDSTRAAAVLGTRATVEAGLYRKALARRGIPVVEDPRHVLHAEALIDGVKSRAPAEVQADRWNALTTTLLERGIDCAILASTELAAIEGPDSAPLTLVDSSSELARELVRRWRLISQAEA